jgi:hypothetical protein
MSLLGFFAAEYRRAYAFCPTGEGGGIDNSCSPTGEPGGFKKGDILPSDFVYHNTTKDAFEIIQKEGFSQGSFSNQPIDFGGNVWIATRKSNLPDVQSHKVGNRIDYEPGDKLGNNPITPNRLFLVDKRGRVIRQLD